MRCGWRWATLNWGHRLPDEINWPTGAGRFRIFLRFRIPSGGDGYYRWAVRFFGWELVWVNRRKFSEGYFVVLKAGRYDPDSEWHWPRPRALREGSAFRSAGIGGHWWQPW